MFSCSSSSNDNKNSAKDIVLPKAVSEHNAANCPDISGATFNVTEVYEDGVLKETEVVKGEVISTIIPNGVKLTLIDDLNRKDEVTTQTIDGSLRSTDQGFSFVGYCSSNKTIEIVAYEGSSKSAELSYAIDADGNLEETLKCFNKKLCEDGYIRTHNR